MVVGQVIPPVVGIGRDSHCSRHYGVVFRNLKNLEINLER